MSVISLDVRNFGTIRSQGALYDYVKYDEFTTVPFLSFSSCRRLQQTTELIFTLEGSYDAVSRNGVPFGGLDNER